MSEICWARVQVISDSINLLHLKKKKKARGGTGKDANLFMMMKGKLKHK